MPAPMRALGRPAAARRRWARPVWADERGGHPVTLPVPPRAGQRACGLKKRAFPHADMGGSERHAYLPVAGPPCGAGGPARRHAKADPRVAAGTGEDEVCWRASEANAHSRFAFRPVGYAGAHEPARPCGRSGGRALIGLAPTSGGPQGRPRRAGSGGRALIGLAPCKLLSGRKGNRGADTKRRRPGAPSWPAHRERRGSRPREGEHAGHKAARGGAQ